MKTVTINGQTFELKFGLRVFRLLGVFWDLPGLNEVLQRLSTFENNGNITFGQIDTIVDLMRAAITGNDKNPDCPDPDDIGDYIFANPETMQLVMEGLMESMPTEKVAGKLKAVKKAPRPK